MTMGPHESAWRLSESPLRWSDDGTPSSDLYGDIYYAPAAGLAETRHVFLDGCGLPDAWQDRPAYAIGELGFGTGLNFAAAWMAWRDSPAPRPHLCYISVEGHPLPAADATRALRAAGVPDDLVRALDAAWPPPQPGSHTRDFEDGAVRLILLHGPVDAMLTGLNGRVDAWFLDGFAPSRNPAMWAPPVLERIAALSGPGTRLASFSTAGAVRRGLGAVGFAVAKVPGFGHKREALRATFAPDRNPQPPRLPDETPPWLPLGTPLSAGDAVLVIGGGVAGCAAAHALHRAGLRPTLLDAAGTLASAASGNPVGLFMPRLTATPSADGRFHAAAFLYARHLYTALNETAEGPLFIGPDGILALPGDARTARRHGQIADRLPWPAALLRQATPEDLVSFVPAENAVPDGSALMIGAAACLRPARVCAALAGSLPRRTNAPVARLHHTATGLWQALSANGSVLGEAPAVVVAGGALTPALLPDAALPLEANRGQISILPADPAAPPMPHAVTWGGYVTPAVRLDESTPPLRVLGASYAPVADATDTASWSPARPEDHSRALIEMAERLPTLAATLAGLTPTHRVSLRCIAPDRRPLVGPVHDAAAYEAAFAALRHGPFAPAPSPEQAAAAFPPGLWMLGGLGSRGFQTAPLAAALLAAAMTGQPLPVEEDVRAMLHPARFLMRRLKRGDGGEGRDTRIDRG